MADFRSFLSRRKAAAEDYGRGQPDGVEALSTRHDPASFFGPDGSALQGAETVRRAYVDGGHAFGSGGETSLDILQAEGDDKIGYWSGLQHFKGEIGGKPVAMTLRVTELFRREDGDWKLVHRHADPLKG